MRTLSVSALCIGMLAYAVIGMRPMHVDAALTYNWKSQTGSGERNWSSIAMSNDGSKLIAAEYDGYIYRSTDGGETWTQITSAGARLWTSVAIGGDGTRGAAVAEEGYVYGGDFGSTWAQQYADSGEAFADVDMTDDGTTIVAVVNGGDMLHSTNSGSTWTVVDNAYPGDWVVVAVSGTDGTKIAAAKSNNPVETTTNNGQTWNVQVPSGMHDWRDMDMTNDGARVVGVTDTTVKTSVMNGLQWTDRTSAGTRDWRAISMSSDGSKLIAAAYDDYLYTSDDYGTTWTRQDSANKRNWTGAAISATGNKVAALGSDITVYTDTDGPQSGSSDSGNNTATIPNNGDANGDGIQDATQSNVTGVTNPVLESYAVLESTCDSHTGVAVVAQSDKKDGSYTYPAGLMNFTLNCSTSGGTATVTQYYYGLSSADDFVVRKYNTVTQKYSPIPGAKVSQVTIGGQKVVKVVYAITDGGPLDQDGVANGKIVDPSGLALGTNAPNSGYASINVWPYVLAGILGIGAILVAVRKSSRSS